MGIIDVGAGTFTGSDTASCDYVYLDTTNPANGTGVLDKIEIYWGRSTGTGVTLGTWGGSGTSWTRNDYESLGSIAAGSITTFTGKNLSVNTGEVLAIRWNTSGTSIYFTTGGSGRVDSYPTTDDWNVLGGTRTFRDVAQTDKWAMYATGHTVGFIDIGAGATYTSGSDYVNSNTSVSTANPANDAGILDTIEAYFLAGYDGTSVKIGTFTNNGTLNYTSNDYESLGTVTSGSKQTFTGKSCSVSAGNYIGCYSNTGRLWTRAGDACGYTSTNVDYFDGQAHSYTNYANGSMGLYATGGVLTAPTVTTQSASSVSYNTMTGNGNVTSLGTPASISERGICYKSGSGQTPTTSDSTVHDHTDATGAFTESLTGLLEVTTYSLRAYAINSTGTAYGSVVEATTLGAPAMTKLYLEHGYRHGRFSRKGISKGITK